MSLERADALQRRWKRTGALAGIERALASIGFSDSYVKSAISRRDEARSKVIKDSTWGMIEIDASCVRLLDSPLLQRLRGVKQLGFSYLTYPSAEHTRFIHSLGMYCVVSRFLEIVQRRPAQPSNPQFPYSVWGPTADHSRLMCHAALLHDIGHLPFSHVSEKILQSDPTLFRCGRETVEEFLFAAEDELEKSLALAEAISLAIVLTPGFKKFYVEAISPGADVDDCLRIATLVAGLPPSPGLTGLASLISGTSIDADKIDYINRDAHSCGIPVGIDVARLFMRSSFLEVKPAELQRLRSSDVPPQTAEVIFVVNASGLDSIEEIGQARTLLYHRVYLHQTTRNAERLLSKALLTAAKPPSSRLRDAFDLWSNDDQMLLTYLSAHKNTEVAELAQQLLRRQLPKRASAFGRSFVRPCVPIDSIFPSMAPDARKALAKQITGTSLEHLRAKKLVGDTQREIESRISAEAAKLARLLRRHGYDAPSGSPSVVSLLPMPNVEPNRSDCIVLENDQLNSNSASSVSDEQMEATDIIKSIGYVMTESKWREFVFLATKAVFYETPLEPVEVELSPYPGRKYVVQARRRLLLDDDAVMRRVRVQRDRSSILQHRAAETGYFDNRPRLAPLNVDENLLNSLATRFHDFDGQGGWSVSVATIKAFLSQFPVAHRDSMAKLLNGMKVLSRVELVQLLEAGFQRVNKSGAGFIVGLSPDSGGNARTLAEQELKSTLEPHGWSFKKSIRDVFSVAKPGDCLVLCDDNVTSGSQALCQLMAWMGVPESKWSEEQKQERGIERTPLDKRDMELLAELDLWLVTAAGTPHGAEFLSAELPKIGLAKFKGLIYEMEISTSGGDLDGLEPFLKDVGTSLMISNRHPNKSKHNLSSKQLKACRNDAVGYGNAKGLFCTPFNVPVGTVSALWAPGVYKDEPWIPLLIRRGYIDRLVLA
jgi:HD superfamily phosphohydrolase